MRHPTSRLSSVFFALLTAPLGAFGLASCSSSSSNSVTEDASHDAKQTGDADDDKPDAKSPGDAAKDDDGAAPSVPVTQTLTAKTLSAPVTVVRDAYGIPHIYGKTFQDVAYAEGYVMAKDRLIEMDLGRRQGEGTLGELVGQLSPAVLGMDIAMRMHHLKTTAATTWAQLQASTDAKDKALAASITSYAAGINAYVANLNDKKEPPLPTALSFYDPKTFPAWTEVDSFVLSYLQAFQLVYDSDTEITYTQIQTAGAAIFDNATDPDLAARKGIANDFELLSPQDATFTRSGWNGFDPNDTSEAKAGPLRGHGPKGLPKRATTSKEKALALNTATAVQRSKTADMLALLAADAKTLRGIGNDRMVYPIRGSNNFILGPDLTADKHVILGNDTHLGLSNPPIFYLVQLVASGGELPVNAMGVNFPGIPGIVLGNNEHVAWAATDNYIDVTDVYQETVVKCSDSTPYAGTGDPCVVYNGLNVKLVPRVETFRQGFDGGFTTPVTETFYDVPQHGPIIPRLDANYNILPLGSSELSVKYTGYEPAQLLRGLLGVFTAKTMQEAVDSLDKDFTVGGENWLIGDDQGNFGWTQVCTVPRRAPGHAPWLVLPGDGSAEWGPSMDRHYIPHDYNPKAGFLTTANNDPIGVTKNNDPFFGQPVVGGSPLYLGFDYDPGTRVGRMTKRIKADIAAGHKFVLSDVQSIQSDTVSEWGEAMAPTFIAVAKDLAAEVATPGTHPDLTAIVEKASATAKQLVPDALASIEGWTSFDTPSGLDGETSAQQLKDSKAALIDAVFYSNFSHRTFDDEVAKLGVTPLDTELRKLLVRMCTDPGSLSTQISKVTKDNILFDDLTTTDVVESKEQIAAQAILDTLGYLAKTLGNDSSKWTWGSVHTLTLDFLLPLPNVPNLPATGDKQYPHGYPRHGDEGTVDPGAHGLSLTDYTYDLGPAIRFGADLSTSGIAAQNALPGGEVFDPASPHYQDQLALWLANKPFPLAQTLAAVNASAAAEYAAHKDGKIVFTP